MTTTITTYAKSQNVITISSSIIMVGETTSAVYSTVFSKKFSTEKA
jgi:hypothetical protein